MKKFILLLTFLVVPTAANAGLCELKKMEDLKKCEKGDVLFFSNQHIPGAIEIARRFCDYSQFMTDPTINGYVNCVYIGYDRKNE